jgi:hypothetical protein
VKAAAPLICRATMFLAAACPPWANELRLLDAPGAVRRLPADREALGAGRVGELRVLRSPVPLVLGAEAVPDHTAEGIPVAWYLADPGIGEWEVAADMLDAARGTGALRPGMIVLAGKGTDERRRYGNLGGIQQWIESVYDNRQVPAQPRTPRRPHPRRSVCRHRPAAAALAACIWHNWSVKTTGLRSLTGYDH